MPVRAPDRQRQPSDAGPQYCPKGYGPSLPRRGPKGQSGIDSDGRVGIADRLMLAGNWGK
jgi:hypothetical protein